MSTFFKANLSGKGVVWNGLVKGVSLAIIIVVELLYTRFLLHRLGAESYSLIPLTSNTIQFSSIITYAILAALGRFVSLEVHNGRIQAANEYFNVVFYVLIALSLFVLFPVFSAISWFSPKIFIIPKGLENVTRFLFATVLFSFILVSIGSVLSIGTFVYNRLDLVDFQNLGKIIISRTLAVILIFYAGLQLYGVCIGLLIGSLAGFITSCVYWKKINIDLSISIKFWSVEKYHQIKGFFSWVFLYQVGGRALIYLDLIVVNRLYGAIYTGWYGLAFFFPSRLRFLTGTFSGLINPMILKYYSANDIDGMLGIANRAIRVVGIVFALPVGFICGFYKPIFSIWVGEQYRFLFGVAVILTIHVSLNTSSNILTSILSTTNKVKVPSLVSIFFAVINIVLAVVLGHPKLLGMGMIGIALAGLITLTSNSAIFTPYYIGLILNRSPLSIYKSFIPGIIGTAAIFFLSFLLSHIPLTSNLFGIVVLALMVSAIYALFGWFFLMQPLDRKWLSSLFVEKIRKKNF